MSSASITRGLRYGTIVLLLVLLAPAAAHVGFALAPEMESYVVLTSSMSPEIGAGSVVYVAATGDYEADDVVTFTRENTVVTHRIVEETSSGFITKGDANEAPDDRTVSREEVVGEVVFSLPLYGYLLTFARSSSGVLLFVVIPALLLVVTETAHLIRD